VLRLISGLFIFLLVPLHLSQAYDIPVNITGNIIIPSCTINNGNQFTVPFGAVRVSELGSNPHRQTVTLPVSCPDHQGTAYVRVTGTEVTSSNNNVVQTSLPGLGIALYQGDTSTPLQLGQGTSGYGYELADNILTEASFTFSAELYKIPDNTVMPGAFSATAIISITYR